MNRSELITTPFTATSTADDVVRGVDLTGLRAVVTGASSGLGRETARVLAIAGAEVSKSTAAAMGRANLRGKLPRICRVLLS